MNTTDPLVPALAGVLADLLRFLDECEDDEVADDTAVGLLENVAGELNSLPPAQRERLTAVFTDLGLVFCCDHSGKLPSRRGLIR
ncbi:hypothetical protein GCM10009759_50150 [Kitasatospora saccharophila]|uniref:Uncharacterized protein n=1 Tax=Kitasatospora saccharophila TaxID=407973 RepID=A0ABN2XCA3_9ACTN